MIKIIAYITMVIDHVTISLWQTYLDGIGINHLTDPVYQIGKGIGRMAFVLFVFGLIEGMIHTHDPIRYLQRLFCFAIISEAPFDLACYGTVFYVDHQNVMFTLFLGALVIFLLRKTEPLTRQYNAVKRWLIQAGIILIPALAAEFIRSDYRFFGVLLIAFLYLGRANEIDTIKAGLLALLIGRYVEAFFQHPEYVSQYFFTARYWKWVFQFYENEILFVTGFVVWHFYNGKRGKQLPHHLTYWIYPVHLLLLGIIRMACFTVSSGAIRR